MTEYERLSLVIASVSAIVSLIAIIITLIMYRSTSLASRRTHSIELFQMWKNVNEIDASELIAVDLINAIHALEFTAVYYKYRILDRKIIKCLYSEQYTRFYEKLSAIDKIIPGTSTNCRSSLSISVKDVYKMLNEKGA